MEDTAMIKRVCELFSVIVFCLVVAHMIQSVAFAADGKVIYDKVQGPALEGNLLEDSADRDVIVYLPPSYESSPEKRYPVVYLLHGYTLHAADWTGGGTYGGYFNILSNLNRFMTQNPTHEMIIVIPDAYNKYRGSWYVNSSVTGNWEDFITQELIRYIDANYRSLPQNSSRGITGHSMGSIGAWILAIKHPDIYGAVYALSGGGPLDLALDWLQNENIWRTVLLLEDMSQFSKSEMDVQDKIALASAFSPNPGNPPFYVDFPFQLVNDELRKIDSVWQRWILGFDIVSLIGSHPENVRRLKGIRFGWGEEEIAGIEQAQVVSQTLTKLDIPHVFETYEGGHNDNVPGRIEGRILPFFAEILAFEMLPVETDMQPQVKPLETTWGETK
jgi:S-formylglutathione hydrolase